MADGETLAGLPAVRLPFESDLLASGRIDRENTGVGIVVAVSEDKVA